MIEFIEEWKFWIKKSYIKNWWFTLRNHKLFADVYRIIDRSKIEDQLHFSKKWVQTSQFYLTSFISISSMFIPFWSFIIIRIPTNSVSQKDCFHSELSINETKIKVTSEEGWNTYIFKVKSDKNSNEW